MVVAGMRNKVRYGHAFLYYQSLVNTNPFVLLSWLSCLGCACFHSTATPYQLYLLFFSTDVSDVGGWEEMTRGEIHHAAASTTACHAGLA